MDAEVLALLKDTWVSLKTHLCIFGQLKNTSVFEGYTFVIVNLMNDSINLPAEKFAESFCIYYVYPYGKEPIESI